MTPRLTHLPSPCALLCGLLLVLLGGCDRTGANAGATGAAVEVGYLEVHPAPVALQTELTGRVSAIESAEVRPQVDGVIRERLFAEGTQVKAGQALYRIDPAAFDAALASAEAALNSAQAAAALAHARADRYRQIVDRGAISRDSNEEIQAAAAEADAAVGVARAQREAARVNLEYTRVRAPIGGRIGRSLVTPGALVTARQSEPIALIQNDVSVYVDLAQSAAQVLALRQAEAAGRQTHASTAIPVTLLLDDGTTYGHGGRLEFTETSVDTSTGAVTVRALFPNPEGLLLPGTYVRARIATGTVPAALTVPQTAISRDPKGGAMLTLVDTAAHLETRPVTLGAAVGTNWIVSAGLKDGERVIVEGLGKLRPGLPVRPVPAGSAPAAGR